MERATQFSVVLPNKRGQLAELSRCLAKAKANIRAIAVAEITELGTVRLVVDKPEAAVEALTDEGFAFTQSEVLVVPLQNKVGVLAEVCEKLAGARVNISFLYGSTGKGRGTTHVVVGTPNMKAAEKALG